MERIPFWDIQECTQKGGEAGWRQGGGREGVRRTQRQLQEEEEEEDGSEGAPLQAVVGMGALWQQCTYMRSPRVGMGVTLLLSVMSLYFVYRTAFSSNAVVSSSAFTNHDRTAGQSQAGQSHGGFIHVIVQYPVLKAQLDHGDDSQARNEAAEKRRVRQAEYTDALISNLMHPAVARVHLMLEHEEDEKFIIAQITNFTKAHEYSRFLPAGYDVTGNFTSEQLWKYLQACDRMRFVRLGRFMLYSDAFEYARKHLAGRACVVQNGDISLSLLPEHVDAYQRLATREGMGVKLERKLNSSVWMTHEGRQKAFVISRSDSISCPNKISGDCSMWAGQGSYDTFLFVSPLPEILEWQVPMPQNVWGAENRVLYTIKCLNISVTNPCLELATTHHHCDENYRPSQHNDPPNLPQVWYENNVQHSYPAATVTESMMVGMSIADFPVPETCHHFPWNGPEAVSEEVLRASRASIVPNAPPLPEGR